MKQHIYQIFLLLLLSTWFFLNEVYQVLPLIDSSQFFYYIFLYTLIPTVGYGIQVYFKKPPLLAWLNAIVISFFLLFYGYFKDLIGSWNPLLDKHTVFIPIWILLNVSLFILANRKNWNIKKIQSFVLTCLCLFIGYNIYGYFMDSSIKPRSQNLYQQSIKDSSKPNIYIIVFDELSRLDQLEKYGYPVQRFIDTLQKMGIQYIPESYSYTDVTPISVSGTLNSMATNVDDLHYPVSNYDKFAVWNEYKNNHLYEYLSEQGYHTELYGILSFKNLKNKHSYSILSSLSMLMLRQNTFMGRLNDEVSWNLLKYNVPILKDLFIGAENKMRYESFVNDSLNLESLKNNIATNRQSQAKFTLAHFMYPHYPLSKDSLGRYYPFTSLDDEKLKNHKGYIEQVKYTETVIINLIKDIQQIETPTIAVILGDHGYRSSGDTSLSTKSFLAYYSNIKPLEIPDSFSSVNVMRKIFNDHFGYQFSMDTSKPKLLYY